MTDDNPLMVYAGSYGSKVDAQADFDSIKHAHRAGLIGRYQSALFAKDEDGQVKVLNTDSTTRTSGAKWGVVTGAVVGLLFPPSIIAGLIWGGGIGLLVGDLAKGWGHGDIRDLGETLDAGQSGVVLVAEVTPDVTADRILKKATKVVNKEIKDEDSAIRNALDEIKDDDRPSPEAPPA